MIYNFEYELKLMLTETEYERLITSGGYDAFRQVNYYFDTTDFAMYENKVVIRIREKSGDYELTVKTKKPGAGESGIVAMDEENISIPESTALVLIEGKVDILDFLPESALYKGKKLEHIGTITTIRKLISINEGLPMAEIDKSMYDGIADYELEWEISEEKYNKAIESLRIAGITLDNREIGLSKYGRLVDRLMEDN